MTFDPQGDYPNHPFFYRRNVIKLAAEAGLGPNQPDKIEVVGVQPEEIAVPFKVDKYEGETNRPEQLARGAECVTRYRNDRDALVRKYPNRYLALFDGEVLWDALDMQTIMNLEKESGRDWKSVPQFVVKCVPEAEEIERLNTYNEEAAFAAA